MSQKNQSSNKAKHKKPSSNLTKKLLLSLKGQHTIQTQTVLLSMERSKSMKVVTQFSVQRSEERWFG
ncbi:hypothetical protein THERMOS_731 [Bathymodiolus thermophilus thioautotrophic gill symbiont]|uniref:Uncharacterized protein n=1 Tax=Bathymodiolus thermophilus thioautotrophic gill symbiont TaxID=2360 RepID=A0A8H9CFA7_9GAMM|nr:hypothetical protein THERMOS_731 [Bathymodiolus thermophilus thioautotrophic gill symbiont]